MVDQYPKKMKALSAANIPLTGSLYDLEARFNLNNLLDKKFMDSFTNLVGVAQPSLNKKERISLALALQDWLYIYDIARGEDEYTYYYLSQKPPYYPSGQIKSKSFSVTFS